MCALRGAKGPGPGQGPGPQGLELCVREVPAPRGPAGRHTEPGCPERAPARPVRLLAALRTRARFVNSSEVWDRDVTVADT